MSGHNQLNYFQSLLNNGISPSCRLCEEENETFDHWFECPVMRIHRTEILQVPNVYVLTPNEWSIAEMLNFLYLPIINCIVEWGHSLQESGGASHQDSGSSVGRAYGLEPD